MGDVGGVFPDVADFIRGADVLLIPVGGNYTVDAFDALSYVLAARPAIVVPMHYKPRIVFSISTKLTASSNFLTQTTFVSSAKTILKPTKIF